MYIKNSFCISPQQTTSPNFFTTKLIKYVGNKYNCIKPNYKEIIPPKLLRRMGNANKNGVYAAMSLLKENSVDGIIIGTTNASMSNSINFLKQVFEYNEGNLTPTNFIQGTPNSTAGSIAQLTNNNKYNITHVQKGLAFENSLIDALMLVENKDASSLIVGNIEELSDYNYNLDYSAGMFKKEEINSETLLQSNTKGTVCGEGSAMFLLNSNKGNNIVAILDVGQISFATKDEVNKAVISFLQKNKLHINDIDALVLGISGDIELDKYYYNTIENLFPRKSLFIFKNLVGEYPTSSAFGTWLAYSILLEKEIPQAAIIKKDNSKIKTILVYNHYNGEHHGFILLSTCIS